MSAISKRSEGRWARRAGKDAVAPRAAAASDSAHASLIMIDGGATLQRTVTTFDGHIVGEAKLPPVIFGQDPRPDIMHAYVKWQDHRRHKGRHKTQSRNEVSRTGKKMYKQKGTGGARHGSRRAAQFVGGAKAHGPVLRDAQTKLPKKMRKLGLAHALSDRALRQRIQVFDKAEVNTHKTSDLDRRLKELGLRDVLIVTGNEPCDNLKLASKNLPYVDILPVEGLNVRAILLRENLVLTTEALYALGHRYDVPIDVDVGVRPAWSQPEGGYAQDRVVYSIAEHRKRIDEARAQAQGRRKSVDRSLEDATHDRDLSVSREAASADRLAGDSTLEPPPPVVKSVEQDATNADFRRYVRALQLGTEAERIEVMRALRTTRPRGPWLDETVRRLLPLLVSDNRVEALEAAETLCHLRYREAGARADRLSAIMHDEGVEFVTYVDKLEASGGRQHVRLRARLSRTLPLHIGGERVTLEIPAWLARAKKLSVRISGFAVKAESIQAHEASADAGDILAADLEFDMAADGDQEVLVDFYADNRWLDRQSLSLQV